MAQQNFKNHRRLSVGFHFILLPVILAVIIGSGINLREAMREDDGVYSASLILAMSFIVFVIAFFARGFALKAQDRAIRSEENLRYFAITGKLMDNALTMPQIIALRFAPNNELMDLAHEAVQKRLCANDIKKAIKNWKEDHNRV